MAPILKMASQHVKSVMLRNTINALPMRSARTPLPAWKHSRFQGSNSNSFRHTRAYQTLDYQTPAYKTPAGPPDGWGYTLFDCDHDLDIVDSISNEASELGIEHLDLMYPKDKKHVVERLNESLFHLLLHKFLYRESRDEVVYLGALAMRLGVRIRETEMRWLRESVGCVKMYDEAREQMWAALKGYNPEGGHPWKFSCMGPIETQWQGGVEGSE